MLFDRSLAARFSTIQTLDSKGLGADQPILLFALTSKIALTSRSPQRPCGMVRYGVAWWGTVRQRLVRIFRRMPATVPIASRLNNLVFHKLLEVFLLNLVMKK